MRAGFSSVLLVQRERTNKTAIEQALLREGLRLLWADGLAEAERLAEVFNPSLIGLDVTLAPDDCWQVFRSLRRHKIPIVLLTGRLDSTLERLALRLGADDCLSWEHGVEQAVLRMRFVLRRAPSGPGRRLSFGDLELDPARGTVRTSEKCVALSRSEYGVLAALVRASGRPVPRDQLVVWARGQAGALPLARSVEAHVRSLRRKLGDDGREPKMVLSVRGFGYRLAALEETAPAQLAEAVFQGLSEPLLVVDAERHVKRANRAAAALLGLASEAACDDTTCAILLGCGAAGNRDCSALAAAASHETRSAEVVVHSRGKSLAVEERVTPLADTAGHLLIQLCGTGRG